MMRTMAKRMSLLTFAGARAFQWSVPVASFGTSSASIRHDARRTLSRRLVGTPQNQEDAGDEVWEPPSDFTVDERHLTEEEIESKKPYVPPDFSVVEDDVHHLDEGVTFSESSTATVETKEPTENPGMSTKRKHKRDDTRSGSSSWMEKNVKFSSGSSSADEASSSSRSDSRSSRQPRRERESFDQRRGEPRRGDDRNEKNRTFRQDFRGTRVFVQGLPLDASWQDVKDHFRVAGDVVFASVSKDINTGESKGFGVVQYETTDMAMNAIKIMRDNPLDGHTLYVREDVQERDGDPQISGGNPMQRGEKRSTVPQTWTCGDDSNTEILTEEEKKAVFSLIRARDDARKRRNYDASDDMREELKLKFGVHVDDRLKMWWVSLDGRKVPQSVSDLKGDGRWGDLAPWRQIPTIPDYDACVDPDLVNGLLKQRDVARREKDFSTADALLEEAKTSPDGDSSLRIHDESRTWRIWTPDPPPRQLMYGDDASARKSPAEQCIDIVTEHAPEKLEEVQLMLQKFKGREFNILKKLKQRYLS